MTDYKSNRIKELAPQCWELTEFGLNFNYQKFAELIVKECTAALFDESERLSGLSLNEESWDYAEEYKICSDQCINDIALIEKHFGVEE